MHQLFVVFDGFAPAVTVLFPAAVLMGGVSMTLRSHLWRTVSTWHDPLIDALLVYFVLAAAYLVLTPQPHIEGRVQVFPGGDLWMALRAAPGDAQPWVQLAGNLLLLLPLGALVPLRVAWFDKLSKVTLGGMVAASAIEVIQLLCVGGRVASTDDVVLNTTGVVIGGLLVRGPWWEGLPVQGSGVVVRATGPQHSVAEPGSHSVWGLKKKLEEEQGKHARELPTTEIAKVESLHPVGQFPSMAYQPVGEPLREPAHHL